MTDVETLFDQASRARSLAARCPSSAIAAILLEFARDREVAACRLVARRAGPN